jgi:hypothetical protein
MVAGASLLDLRRRYNKVLVSLIPSASLGLKQYIYQTKSGLFKPRFKPISKKLVSATYRYIVFLNLCPI